MRLLSGLRNRTARQRRFQPFAVIGVVAGTAASSLVLMSGGTAHAVDIGSTGWAEPSAAYKGNANFGKSGCPGVKNPYKLANRIHAGADYPASVGAKVYSVGPGKVLKVDSAGTQEEALLIQHTAQNGKKFIGVYAHLKRTSGLGKGSTVKKNTRLGTLRNYRYGVHLHFGIYEGTKLPSRYGTVSCTSGLGKFQAPGTFLKANPLVAARSTVTVDDPQRFGDSKWWLHRTGTSAGYASDYYLTWSAGKKYSSDVVYATWTTGQSLKGKYEVSCFVPTAEAVATARYKVGHGGGTSTVTRVQKNIKGWTSLGTYTFAGKGTVRLGDATGADDYDQLLGFDACKWVPR